MGLLNVLGLVYGAIGFWGFSDNMFPAPQDGHSTFKVFVALDQTANPDQPDECCLSDAGGTIRYAKLFNQWGEDIGHGGMFGNLKSDSEEVSGTCSGTRRGPRALFEIATGADGFFSLELCRPSPCGRMSQSGLPLSSCSLAMTPSASQQSVRR
jgi:hypothetical protein